MLQDSIRLRYESYEMQINTLIYSMGDEADDILDSFRLSEEHRKTFEVVRMKFESFFVKKTNTIQTGSQNSQ